MTEHLTAGGQASQRVILHVLRNPWGHSDDVIRDTRLRAADEIERLQQQVRGLQYNLRGVTDALGCAPEDSPTDAVLELQRRLAEPPPEARFVTFAAAQPDESTPLDDYAGQVACLVVRAVAELPDRNSPEDQPEMMLVTGSELEDIVGEAIERVAKLEDPFDQPAPPAARAAEPPSDALLEALESIRQYANDTLSGRVDGPDDREWQRACVVECRNRARDEIERLHNENASLEEDLTFLRHRVAAMESDALPPNEYRQIGVKQRAPDGRTEFVWWDTVPEGTPIFAGLPATKDAGQ